MTNQNDHQAEDDGWINSCGWREAPAHARAGGVPGLER